MANFAVSSIRPKLMQQSAEYERKKFQEFLEKQPSMTLFLSFFPSDLPVNCVSLLVDHEKKSDLFISSRIRMVNDNSCGLKQSAGTTVLCLVHWSVVSFQYGVEYN